MKRMTPAEWHDISSCLDEVLELEGDAREAWLRALEQARPEVATKVRAYLADLVALDARDFLGKPGFDVPPSATLTGKQFGPYTLHECIGHGGTGTVWLGHRSDGHYQGRAAVKLLNTALIGHPSASRFVREGSVLARLQHPNIAHLLDAGVAPGGQPYLVLEYVNGTRITEYCDREQLSVRQRVHLFLDVLAAVAHAHSNLIVHRDLKPSNILVTDRGVVKLLDFGVAALLSHENDDSEGPTRVTVHGAAGLTPGYAAPEQLTSGAITTATDVYALGTLLFVLLTGRHPLSDKERSSSEMARLTLEGDVPRASEVAEEPRVQRTLRGDLDNIIAVALRRAPTERYTTVDFFAQDLRRYLGHEPVLARPPSLVYRASRFVRRHRLPVGAVTIIAGLIVGGAITMRAQMLEAERQRDEIRFQSKLEESTVEFLRTLLLSDGGPDRPALTVEQRVDLGVDMLEKQHANDPSFAGRMLIQLAQRDNTAAKVDLPVRLFTKAYDLGRSAHDELLMVDAQCGLVQTLEDADRRTDTAARIAEARTLLARHPEATPVLRADCLLAEARVADNALRVNEAIAALEQAKQILETSGDRASSVYTAVLSYLGSVYSRQNNVSAAIDANSKVLSAYRDGGRADTLGFLLQRQNRATLLSQAGELLAAVSERESVATEMRKFTQVGAEPVALIANEAAARLRLGEIDRAESLNDNAMERARTDSSARLKVQVLANRIGIAVERCDWARAKALANEAHDAVEAAGNPLFRARIEILRAQIAMGESRLDDAEAIMAKVLASLDYRGERPARGLAAALLVASRVALAQGKPNDAERFAKDALAINERVARSADSSADVGEALLRLVQARLAADPRADVRAQIERAVRCLTNGYGVEHARTKEAAAVAATVPAAA
jgi:serine/threonine protein kinase/tetratricopeptide (TPR) repeat protein